MSTMVLDTIADLVDVQASSAEFDQIVVNCPYFARLGLLRHALKYSSFHAASNAVIQMKSPAHTGYGLNRRCINRWQILSEAALALSGRGVFMPLEQKGDIAFRIGEAFSPCRSVTFGIVFSGRENECSMLEGALRSISEIRGVNSDNCEIVVLGGGECDGTQMVRDYRHLNLRYIYHEGAIENGRFLVSQKKSRFFEVATNDALVISHTRIGFDPSFCEALFRQRFEVCAPRVYFMEGETKRPYLDYVLVGDYDVTKTRRIRTLLSSDFGDKHLYLMRNRVAYVDGGITIFDRRKIDQSPFLRELAWGEAEDLVMARKMFGDGYLIDYCPDMLAYSTTDKLKGRISFRHRISKSIRRARVHCEYISSRYLYA